jgi:hypothetical protein
MTRSILDFIHFFLLTLIPFFLSKESFQILIPSILSSKASDSISSSALDSQHEPQRPIAPRYHTPPSEPKGTKNATYSAYTFKAEDRYDMCQGRLEEVHILLPARISLPRSTQKYVDDYRCLMDEMHEWTRSWREGNPTVDTSADIPRS